ncbi:MAG: hypothetical protein ACREIA_26605 [Opitutaceae bacterium]
MRHAGRLGRIEKVDELTVRFSFDEPNSFFLEKLASAVDYPRAASHGRRHRV